MPSKYLLQCYKLQDALYAAREKVTEPTEIATLATAWSRLNEQRRIMRGKPLPGTLRPADVKKSNRRSSREVDIELASNLSASPEQSPAPSAPEPPAA